MFCKTKPGSQEYDDLALFRKKQGRAIVKLVQREYEDEQRVLRGLRPNPAERRFRIKPIQRPSEPGFDYQWESESGFSLHGSSEESKGLPDCLSSDREVDAARPD